MLLGGVAHPGVVGEVLHPARPALVGELLVDHRAGAQQAAQVDRPLGEVVVLLVGDEVQQPGAPLVEVQGPVVVRRDQALVAVQGPDQGQAVGAVGLVPLVVALLGEVPHHIGVAP